MVNAGNIITQGFLVAEELHMHSIEFSSVFTREDTSSLPVLCECNIIHWSDCIYQDSSEVMRQYYYSTLDSAMRCFKPAHFNGG